MKLSITLIGLLIFTCVLILFFVLGRDSGSDALLTTRDPVLLKGSTVSDVNASNDADDYYRVIIENNIFRPLNWKPKQQTPAYTLHGTSVRVGGSSSTAYITDRKTGQFYAVQVGDKLFDFTVTEILPKQVKLRNADKSLILYISSISFLSGTSSGGDTSPRPPQEHILPQSSHSPLTHPLTTKDKDRQAWREAQKKHIAELKKMAEKLRVVSEKTRSRMQQHLEQSTSGNSQ